MSLFGSIEKLFNKVEKTFRPLTKVAAVAAATYYGGSIVGKIASQAAFRPDVPQSQVTQPYSPQVIYLPQQVPAARGQIYGMGGYAPPPGYANVSTEGFGAPLQSTFGGDLPPPSSGISPLILISGAALFVVLLLFIVRR